MEPDEKQEIDESLNDMNHMMDTSLGVLPLQNTGITSGFHVESSGEAYFFSSEPAPHILRKSSKKRKTEGLDVSITHRLRRESF